MDKLHNASTHGAEALVDALHPYFPLGVAIPNYVENKMHTLVILAYFAVGCGSILLLTMLVASRLNSRLPRSEIATVMWFVLSGCIHLGMEGYMVYNNADIAGQSTVLGEAWKEYSLSDSRYLTRDTFVVTMEAVTAIFWGPLCLVIAWCIVADHPLRHALQPLVSLGQIYGDVLYFATCAFEYGVRGIEFGLPEFRYFVGYFIFLNMIWIIIPGILLYQSIRETVKAFAAAKTLKAKKDI
jgi:cholestenol delta-isomerase